MHKSLRDTGVFFALIGQHLFVWSAYEICQMVGECLEQFSTVNANMERAIDSVSIIDTLSTIVMMYGITNSVKRATVAEQKLK